MNVAQEDDKMKSESPMGNLSTNGESDANSNATEFLSNLAWLPVTKDKVKPWTIKDWERIPTGLGPNSIIPPWSIIQQEQTGWQAPRLGNMFGLMNMFKSPGAPTMSTIPEDIFDVNISKDSELNDDTPPRSGKW